MSEVINLPPLLLSFKKKTKAWRKKVVDWADSKTFFNYNLVRKSVVHKKINYDLLNGRLYMTDLELILNPENIKAKFIPERILHYPIMNSKLNILKGEEIKRLFDYKVIITNPNSISEIEANKKLEIFARLLLAIENTSLSEEEFNAEIEKLLLYYNYEWLDLKEIKANALLKHYIKEYSIPTIFNLGFMDAMIVGEEIYQCDIVGGEPIIERVNPLKIRVFKSGYSNRIEDADIIIIEDYWSPGKVIDTYYDLLSKKDIEYIESLPDHIGLSAVDSMDNLDERFGFINNNMITDEISSSGFYFDPFGGFADSLNSSLLPYDILGNLRVLRVYWKSKRKIKKVKSYDPLTGEEVFNFYPETYIINESMGEEEEIFYINEAWEGTKIGSDIYINMRPRPILYNRLSNPSRCHFGIIGSVYNLNDSRPYSLVDMMKNYNYLYDVIHDRLNKLIANNWGILINLDLAKVPKGWDIDKWMYYAKVNNLAVVDSFKEGNYGAATGKLAGALNNASSGAIVADLGNTILQYINLLEFIKLEMSEVAGISKQREGLISNRETVGGVERATLLSSHITEWLFTIHDDVKKRALECFLETAKIALRGRSKKFQYILPDSSTRILDIDGDEFAESDYGLVVDNSLESQLLSLKLTELALMALLSLTISFSTLMKLYNSASLAEKQRMIERDELQLMLRLLEALLQLMELELQKILQEALDKELEMTLKDTLNQRDNETKILVATIAAQSLLSDIEEPLFSEEARAKLMENMRLFNERLKLDRERLEFDKDKARTDADLKRRLINKQTKSSNK